MANWHCHFAVVSALVVCNLVLTSAGPVEDFIAKLPGQPDVNFKQYGGYVTVDNKSGRALYYYFVEAVNDTASTPISLWLNGGPGCSSIGGGAFTELGPFYPEADGHGLRINKNSWNKVSNLLFVESPVGVGWSYSNNSADYIRNDDLTAKDMLSFLVRWFKKFPEYSSRDLFLTGESYAGHYIPQLANNALLYNKMAKESKLNLKGLFIGNPLLRLNVDTPAIYEYLWTHGVISDETKHSLDQNCKFNMEKDGVEISDNSKKCKSISKEIEKQIGKFVDEYNVIIDVCPPALYEQQLRLRKKISHMSLGVDVCMTAERSFYFNTPEVQKALHANVTSLPYRWTMCSNFLNYSSIDEGINILPILKNIIQHDIRVWIFSGDQDSVVPLLGSRTNVRNLADDLSAPVKLPYRPWYHEGQVGGWTTVYGDFLTFATVRGASHMVPFSQPALMKYSTEAMKESRVYDLLSSMSGLQSRKMDFKEFCVVAVSFHQLEALDRWEQHACCAYELFEQKGNRAIVIEELALELGLGAVVPVHAVLHDWVRHSDGKLSFLGFVKLLHGVSTRSLTRTQ